jgi:hypothetical protein
MIWKSKDQQILHNFDHKHTWKCTISDNKKLGTLVRWCVFNHMTTRFGNVSSSCCNSFYLVDPVFYYLLKNIQKLLHTLRQDCYKNVIFWEKFWLLMTFHVPKTKNLFERASLLTVCDIQGKVLTVWKGFY